MIDIKVFNNLSADAMLVRKTVFIDEQGFKDEFDETDKTATHLVAYDGNKPIAVCRFFWSDERASYLIGRLAVIREYRGLQLGAKMIKKSEELIKKKGGKEVWLHSQEQAVEFYKKQGYGVCSEMEY